MSLERGGRKRRIQVRRMQRAGTGQHVGYDHEKSAEAQVNEYCDVEAKAESGIGPT